MLSELAAHRLLDDLCVKLGICLPPAEQLRIRQRPPADVRCFVEAVILAEGLKVDTMAKHLYRNVVEMVAEAFAQGGCDSA